MSDQPNLWRRDITWEEGCLSTTRALWCWTKNVYYIQQTILLVTSVLVSIVMKLHSSDRYEGVTSGSHQYSHLACGLVVSMYCQNGTRKDTFVAIKRTTHAKLLNGLHLRLFKHPTDFHHKTSLSPTFHIAPAEAQAPNLALCAQASWSPSAWRRFELGWSCRYQLPDTPRPLPKHH